MCYFQACETQAGINSPRSAASTRTNISSCAPSARPCLTLKTTPGPSQGHVQPELQCSVGVSSHELRAPPPLVLAPSISAPLVIPMSFVQPVCIPVAGPLPLLSNAMPIITSVTGAAQFASVANDCQVKNVPGKSLVCTGSLPAVSQSSKQMKLVLPSNIVSQLDFRKPLTLKINGQKILLQSDKVIPASDGIKILLSDKHASGSISTMAGSKPAVTVRCTPSETPVRRGADKTDVIVIEPDIDFETSQRPLASQESQNLPGVVSTTPSQVAPILVTTSSPALQSSGHLLTTAAMPLSASCRTNSKTVETEPVQGTSSPQETVISEETARASESVVIPDDNNECDDGTNCCVPSVALSIQTTMNGPLVPSKEVCVASSPEACLPSVVSLAPEQSQDHPVQESAALPEIVSVLDSGRLSSSVEPTTTSCEAMSHSCGDKMAGNTQERATGNGPESSLSRPKNLAKRLACNGFESIHAGFNSMLTIFQYLGVCDLLRVATVCPTWCLASQHPKLVRH